MNDIEINEHLSRIGFKLGDKVIAKTLLGKEYPGVIVGWTGRYPIVRSAYESPGLESPGLESPGYESFSSNLGQEFLKEKDTFWDGDRLRLANEPAKDVANEPSYEFKAIGLKIGDEIAFKNHPRPNKFIITYFDLTGRPWGKFNGNGEVQLLAQTAESISYINGTSVADVKGKIANGILVKPEPKKESISISPVDKPNKTYFDLGVVIGDILSFPNINIQYKVHDFNSHGLACGENGIIITACPEAISKINNIDIKEESVWKKVALHVGDVLNFGLADWTVERIFPNGKVLVSSKTCKNTILSNYSISTLKTINGIDYEKLDIAADIALPIPNVPNEAFKTLGINVGDEVSFNYDGEDQWVITDFNLEGYPIGKQTNSLPRYKRALLSNNPDDIRNINGKIKLKVGDRITFKLYDLENVVWTVKEVSPSKIRGTPDKSVGCHNSETVYDMSRYFDTYSTINGVSVNRPEKEPPPPLKALKSEEAFLDAIKEKFPNLTIDRLPIYLKEPIELFNPTYEAESLELPLSPLKKELTATAYRVAATQAVSLSKAAILNLLKKQGATNEYLANIHTILDTEFGLSLVAMTMGIGLTFGTDSETKPGKFAKECRIQSMTTLGNSIMDTIVSSAIEVLSNESRKELAITTNFEDFMESPISEAKQNGLSL